MGNVISDGTGKGNNLKVDSKNRAMTYSVSQSSNEAASKDGDAYNIHTGNIVISGLSAMIYVKNNETRDLFIENIVVALGTATVSELPEVMTYKTITGGDIVTDATQVQMKSNRNYGSPNAIVADTFKGKDGGTIVGEQVGLYHMSAGSRLVANVNKVLPKGATIAIEVDPKLSSGTMKAYVVLVCHLKDSAAE